MVFFLKISSFILLDLNAFKKCLEVSSSESLVIVPLDNLNESRGAVLQRLGENLKIVNLIIIIIYIKYFSKKNCDAIICYDWRNIEYVDSCIPVFTFKLVIRMIMLKMSRWISDNVCLSNFS
jgi:hypothetical protein